MSCTVKSIPPPSQCFDEFGPEHAAADMFAEAKLSLIDFNEALRNGTFRAFVDNHEVENVSVNDRGHLSFNFKNDVSTDR